jgi:hypothetical protein
VTFRDLKKRVTLEATTQQQSKTLEPLRDKPFWIWNQQEHRLQDITRKGYCCFNNICGLPAKQRVEKPIFDYKKLLYDSLSVNAIPMF